MKNLWIIAAIFLLLLSNPHNAAAFSTDHRDNQNSDGSPKFMDPDEQRPEFMITTPDNTEATGRALSFGAVTVPGPRDNTPGAMDFERAFAHQQGKE